MRAILNIDRITEQSYSGYFEYDIPEEQIEDWKEYLELIRNKAKNMKMQTTEENDEEEEENVEFDEDDEERLQELGTEFQQYLTKPIAEFNFETTISTDITSFIEDSEEEE